MSTLTFESQVAEIPMKFLGEVIPVAKAKDDGRCYVPFCKLCKVMGVNAVQKREELREYGWCEIVDISETMENGQEHRATFLTLRSATMWLATIDVREVRRKRRRALIAFQQEATAVISQVMGERVLDVFRPE